MDNEKISIDKISLEIKKLQYPIIFLFRLISYKDNISDINFNSKNAAAFFDDLIIINLAIPNINIPHATQLKKPGNIYKFSVI